jgi:hypothetical protein
MEGNGHSDSIIGVLDQIQTRYLRVQVQSITHYVSIICLEELSRSVYDKGEMNFRNNLLEPHRTLMHTDWVSGCFRVL